MRGRQTITLLERAQLWSQIKSPSPASVRLAVYLGRAIVSFSFLSSKMRIGKKKKCESSYLTHRVVWGASVR